MSSKTSLKEKLIEPAIESSIKIQEETSKTSYFENYINFIYKFKISLFILSIILIFVGFFLGKSALTDFENGGFLPESSESYELSEYFSTDQIIYPRPKLSFIVEGNSQLTYDNPQFQEYYNQIVNNINLNVRGVYGVVSYYENSWEGSMVSNNKQQVIINAQSTDEDVEYDHLQSVVSITPLKVYVGGSIPNRNQNDDYIKEGLQYLEFTSVPVLVILLFFALGGVAAGLLPWYTAMFGISWSLTMLVAFNHSFEVTESAVNVVTIFGLGLSIDYTLFIVSRFAADRKKYPNVGCDKILLRTAKTSGKTVFISGMTVFLCLTGGLFFEELFLVGVCVAVMCASFFSATFANSFFFTILAYLDHNINRCPTPSLKECESFIKKTFKSLCRSKNVDRINSDENFIKDDSSNSSNNIDSPKKSNNGYEEIGDVELIALNSIKTQNLSAKGNKLETDGNENIENGNWYRFGKIVLKYHLLFLFGSFCFLLSFAVVFIVKIKYGLIDSDQLPLSSDVRYVFDHTVTDFSLNSGANIIVGLQTQSNVSVTSSEFLTALWQFNEEVTNSIHSGGRSVSNIYSMVSIGLSNYTLNDYIELYSTPNNITSALNYPIGLTNLQDCTYVTVTMPYFRYSSDAIAIVENIRSTLRGSSFDYTTQSGVSYSLVAYSGVGGYTGELVDLNASLQSTLPIWLCLLFFFVYLILLLMTGSLLLPLKALVVSIFSLGATLGIILIVFTLGSSSFNEFLDIGPTGYLNGCALIFVITVSFGLSVDYEVFLLSRFMEEYKYYKDIDIALLRATQRTGGIITSAAAMLAITTFGALFCKVQFLKLLGFGIGIAVILDATIIRMIVVPATIKLLGKYVFYCPEFIMKVVNFIGLKEEEEEIDSLQEEEDSIVQDAKDKENENVLISQSLNLIKS